MKVQSIQSYEAYLWLLLWSLNLFGDFFFIIFALSIFKPNYNCRNRKEKKITALF